MRVQDPPASPISRVLPGFESQVPDQQQSEVNDMIPAFFSGFIQH